MSERAAWLGNVIVCCDNENPLQTMDREQIAGTKIHRNKTPADLQFHFKRSFGMKSLKSNIDTVMKVAYGKFNFDLIIPLVTLEASLRSLTDAMMKHG